jgi:hypothetical protein
MSNAPQFTRLNRPIRDGEGIFPDSDPVFCPVALSSTETDESVVKVVEYLGFICKQRLPHHYWIVFAAVDGSDIPLELQGHFTNKITLKAAVEKHLAAKARVTA